MSMPIFIGIAATIFILGLVCIIKGTSSEEDNAVPISNPKDIAEFKSSFIPNDKKESSGRQTELRPQMGPTNLSKGADEMSPSGSKSQSEIDVLIQKNQQFEQNIQTLKRENQQSKESKLEKIKDLEEKITTIQREKERLLPNRQIID